MIWLFVALGVVVTFVIIMAVHETELSHRPLTEKEIADMLEEYRNK